MQRFHTKKNPRASSPTINPIYDSTNKSYYFYLKTVLVRLIACHYVICHLRCAYINFYKDRKEHSVRTVWIIGSKHSLENHSVYFFLNTFIL